MTNECFYHKSNNEAILRIDSTVYSERGHCVFGAWERCIRAISTVYASRFYSGNDAENRSLLKICKRKCEESTL